MGNATDEKVLSAIEVAVASATQVKNTLVGVPADTHYDYQVGEVYKRFFTENKLGRWLDLASYQEAFGNRFKLSLTAAMVGKRHTIRILRHSVPLINCTVIKKAGGDVAYFGWTYTGVKADAPVFMTENVEMVSMFDRYFDLLWSEKTTGRDATVNYESGKGELTGIDVVDKVGRWVTVAHTLVDGEWRVESHAVIDIDYSSSQMRLGGEVFFPDGKRKSGIHALKCFVSMNRVNFDYALNRHDPVYPGRCFYTFYLDGSQNCLGGFFVNEKSRIWKDVTGFRIGSPQHGGDRTEDRQRLLQEHKGALQTQWNRVKHELLIS